MYMKERDRALNMVAHLQRAPRVAKLQELQAQVGLLTGEIANQMALRQCATGDQSTLRRTASPMSPFPQSRGFRPASCPPGDTSMLPNALKLLLLPLGGHYFFGSS